MKLLTFLAGALAAPLAFAQSNVTLYGIADVAVEHSNAGRGYKTRIQSGGESASRIGFRGTEDLGGGLKAIFLLEMGYALDNGQLTSHNSQTGNSAVGSNQSANTTGVAVFQRQAWAGLASNAGDVKLGRQYSPLYLIMTKTGPLAFSTGARHTALNNLGPSTFATSQSTRRTRVDNSISYASPTIGGFSAVAIYSTGFENNIDTAADKDGREWGLNASWGSGPIWVGAGYQEIKGVTITTAPGPGTPKTRNWIVGGSYDFGVVKLFLQYNPGEGIDAGGATVVDTRSYGASASIKAGPGTLNLVYNQLDDRRPSNADAKHFGVHYTYPLSKRTDVYAALATIRNESTAAFSIGSGNSTDLTVSPVGYDPKALQFGVRHQF